MPANEGDQKPIDDATTSQQVESVGNIPQDAQVTTGVAMPMPDDTKPAAAESRTAPNNQDPSSNIEQDPFDQLDVPIDLGNTADLFDLDSMFNDAEIIPSGGVESDLDIDFSLGGSADLTNALGDSTMGGINLSTSDNNAGTNEDLNSLLPGLENFVNAPGENNTAVPNTLGNNNTKTAAADQQQTSTAAAPENDGGQPAPDDSFVGTNFDDLFNPSDFNMGNEGNDSNEFNLDQDFGEIGNFDDVWRNDIR
ncbi:uncharacterized protein KY384_005021 [Bacidia gigantensis]|uniref:uncharacterized protein n=1 Tax=Bacidia gigantensis TaxID=2732470 RepID=UPI001D0438F9|nr:uncharacterized protein KY384_005021 [Bacidia gigantensis]KAG8530518.1 hypothetical protein KY384_005021 [Bacidia gigantensis]